MIKDEKLGLEIADNKEEAKWIKWRDSAKKAIELIPEQIALLEEELELNNHILKMCNANIDNV